MTPSPERLAGEKETGHAMADIDVIIALDGAGLRRQRFAAFADQLFEGLVQTDHWPRRTERPTVDRQHIFHVLATT